MKVVGIRFKPAGKVYDFDSGAFVLNIGNNVIVETEQGISFGIVTVAPVYSDLPHNKPLKKVIRLANEKDYQQKAKNAGTEQNANAFCITSIDQLDLQMIYLPEARGIFHVQMSGST